MKVLFIAPYLQKDGWGQASQMFIKALENKCDLSVKNIYLCADRSKHINQDIFPHLSKKRDSYDAVIYKVLPNMVTYNKECGINCAISCLETRNIIFDWYYQMGLMDKVLTFTNYEKDNTKWMNPDSVYPVGEPVDTSKFNKDYGKFDVGSGYKFYFIGENIERKNLFTLIKCYLMEFSYKENVTLVVKSATNKEITELIQKIKQSLRKYYRDSMYPKIVSVDGYLSDDDMCKLHQSCDCFVMPSSGEAFCRPLADAVGFNNQIIINKNTSMRDLVDENNAWLVPSVKSSVYCEKPPMHSIYTCRENWFNINEWELRKALREAYNGTKKTKDRHKLVNKFSLDTVGNNIIKCLQS